jgi:pyridoxal 5'-phosphate synthase pdxT subunit
MAAPSRIGVLAIQGDFEAHGRLLRELGAEPVRVRTPADLDGLTGLVLPGGESTTMSLGMEREGLVEPLRQFARSGAPVLGTCAGMIVLDRDHLGLMDVRTRRNAFGRQVASFETDITLAGLPGWNGMPTRAVFIRAPWVEDAGPDIVVLAEAEGHPVAVLQDNLLAVAFHPEVANEPRLHRWLLERAR